VSVVQSLFAWCTAGLLYLFWWLYSTLRGFGAAALALPAPLLSKRASGRVSAATPSAPATSAPSWCVQFLWASFLDPPGWAARHGASQAASAAVLRKQPPARRQLALMLEVPSPPPPSRTRNGRADGGVSRFSSGQVGGAGRQAGWKDPARRSLSSNSCGSIQRCCSASNLLFLDDRHRYAETAGGWANVGTMPRLRPSHPCLREGPARLLG